MSNRILKRLGMEDIDVDINFNEDEADAVVAEAAVEATESAAEIESTADAAETIEADVESLEALVCVMKNSLDRTNGLDSVSCEMMQVAVAGITSKYPHLDTGEIPSLESFGESPYQNTVISMEGVGEKIKKMLEYLWNLIKSIGKKIADFFVAIYKMFTGIPAKCRAIAKRIKESGKQIYDKELHITYIAPKWWKIGGSKKLAEQIETAKSQMADSGAKFARITKEGDIVLSGINAARSKEEIDKLTAEYEKLFEELEAKEAEEGGEGGQQEVTISGKEAEEVANALVKAAESGVEKQVKKQTDLLDQILAKRAKEAESKAKTEDEELAAAKVRAVTSLSNKLTKAATKVTTQINQFAMTLNRTGDSLDKAVQRVAGRKEHGLESYKGKPWEELNPNRW